MSRYRIIPQMFDVRPVNETGDLDWEKINKIEKILRLSQFTRTKKERKNLLEECLPRELGRKKMAFNATGSTKIKQSYGSQGFHTIPSLSNAHLYQLGRKFHSDDTPVFVESNYLPHVPIFPAPPAYYQESIVPKKAKKYLARKPWEFSFSDLFIPARFSLHFNFKNASLAFATSAIVILLIIGTAIWVEKGFKIKGEVLGTSQEGYVNLTSAMENIKSQNFESSSVDFQQAFEKFSDASKDLDAMGGLLVETSRFIPFLSKLSSGKNMMEAGKHISLAGQSLNETIQTASSLKNPFDKNENASLLDIFRSTEKNLAAATGELKQAASYLDKVNVDDLPQDKKEEFIKLKNRIPEITKATNDFSNNSHIFIELLGGNGPRKYLFLFQNNQEMRATGGFIGSYGLLDIYDGRVRNFVIDGIFNPDGQLKEKIVPPEPIQKISAAWSLHDSNWFPDFPTSAKKAILFFEKTGGPTTDGVITFTPEVMKKLLEVTGPIPMEDYGVTIDSDNFIAATQYEVEIDYDKEENQPKKILSDLAPKVLDKLFVSRDIVSIAKTLSVFSEGLSQKHILLYSDNKELQDIISQEGRSGEILNSSKDYLSVVNTNINGYKTDGVIEESIEHQAKIQPDGSIIDTVTVSRHHTGGYSEFDWWNKVNADYMRIYVPKGSRVMSVEGQTREFTEPPLDYDSLGFKRDPDVKQAEDSMSIDQEKGTRTYEESGKTVFANWVYVSPQETAVIKYTYLLPFKIELSNTEKVADSYSLLIQKQSGSKGSKFSSIVEYPDYYKMVWNYPQDLKKSDQSVQLETDLNLDRFIGIAFFREQGVILNL